MPDIPVEPASPGRYPADMESRVVMLEQIAATTVASLERIERRMDSFERRLEMLDARHHNDFKWMPSAMFAGFSATLAGFGTMLGVMAHGFHWL